MNFFKGKIVQILLLLGASAFMRFYLLSFLSESMPVSYKVIASTLILISGVLFVLRGTAKVIEETTEVLQERTGLAGGLLQSLGTAFPDMVLGIVAALVSLQLRTSNYVMAINYAIIAAATTFGSNIYNIVYASWCLYRQNRANALDKSLKMLPLFPMAGVVKPLSQHSVKPSLAELDTAIDVSLALTGLTALVAISMVLFGYIKTPPQGFSTDLYQLIQPIGFVIFAVGVTVLFLFRKTQRASSPLDEIVIEEKNYRESSNMEIWTHLLLSGLAILFAAESMVHAIQVICTITHIPFIIAGVMAGFIGCLGEMIVIHNYSVNPKGRIGDAVVGVAMDNIVTIIGASIVAMLGGIFLGGSSLILVFVIILSFNTVLISQISKLKNSL